jgi:hypothetical protein
MIYNFPAVCDALTTALGQAIGSSNVYDGPPARFLGSSGLAIGATREDVSSEFTSSPAGLSGGSDQDLTVTCLAWSGGGGVVFKPHRDVVRDIVAATTDRVTADQSLGGVVDIAEVTGGTWMQEQTGEGAIVTCEFRINARKF